MEACASAHHWARQLQKLGHQVKLMAPQFVKPYVKTNKNDAADAEAICEAVSRPNMRFVPIKNVEQQAVLALHRARAGFVKARTAQANQIRGLLGEYGIIIPQGIGHITKRLPAILEDGENELPGAFRQLLVRLAEHLKELDRQVDELEAQIEAWHRENAASRKLAQIPGIGPLTASALVASVGDASSFGNARQLAAWLGLVPRQHSSGGKPMLLGISKRGDAYLRTLLIHGARSVIRVAERKAGDHQPGSRSSSTGATRTWRRWLWRTRTRASSGRCLHMTGTTKPSTRQRRPERRIAHTTGFSTGRRTHHRLLRQS